jgi:Na+-translocating ferredoxin:NAD+ oxidoreductase RnfG subunit
MSDGVELLLKQIKDAGANMAVFHAIETALTEIVDMLQQDKLKGTDMAPVAAAIKSMVPVVNIHNEPANPTPVQVNVSPNLLLQRGGKMSFTIERKGQNICTLSED